MKAMIGTIMVWPGNKCPDGWLFCQGQVVNISTYPLLFSIVTTRFGGDGITTFGLPDLRGRFLAGNGPSVIEHWEQRGESSIPLGLGSFPSGSIHTHTVSASFPGNQTSFTGGSDIFYTLPADTNGSQTATPTANTIMGVGRVQTSPAKAAYIYGTGVRSGEMCARSAPVVATVNSNPSWTAKVGQISPPVSYEYLQIFPPYTVTNFIICSDGTYPPFPSDEPTKQEV